MSTLAAQLAQNASLNASLLVDRSRRKPTTSYLFTGKDADELDLESIYGLGVNSLLSLSSLEPKLRKFEDDLFSEQAKETDRTLLAKERIAELDERLEEFLWVLGPHLMEPPTAKILEWLVRRFRIHEFNVQQVMALFLPYHESPHFAKMITILHIKPNTLWRFLLPYKSAAQKLPRVSLVTEMLKDSDLARFVSSLLPTAMKKGFAHRTIIAFNAATLHDFIKRSKSIDEGTLAHILPALLEPLHQTQKNTVKDAVLGSYILLASLSQRCKISPFALQVVVGEIVSASHSVRTDQLVQTLIAVCGPQDVLQKLPSDVVKGILGTPNIQETLLAAASWLGSENLLHPIVRGLVSKLHKDEIQAFLESVIATPALPPTIINLLTSELMRIAVRSEDETDKTTISHRLLSLIHQRYPCSLRSAADLLSVGNESLKEVLDQLVITLSTVRISSQPNRSEGVDFIISSSDADADIRTMAVKELVKSIDNKKPGDIEDFETIRSVLISRLQDTTASVIEALYENSAAVTPIFCGDPKSFVASLSLAFASQEKPKRSFIKLHLLYLTSHFWPATESSTHDEIFHRILFPLLLFTKSRQKTAELVWDLVRDLLAKTTESSGLNWLDGCDALVKTELAKTEQTDGVELMNQINFAVSSKLADNIINSNNTAAYVKAVAMKLRDNNSHVRLFGYLIALELVKKPYGHQQVEIGEQIQSCLGVDELAGVDDLSQEHLSLEKPDETSFGKYIVTKPNSKATLGWMQIAVVAAIARIPCPTGVVLNWLLESPKCETEGQRYVRLMRAVYQLANTSTSLPIVSSTILQLLFLSLKDQSLAFLAGVWTCFNQEFRDLKTISLLHAAAFLQAHIFEDDGIDFQIILPSIFVSLHDSDAQLCQAAFECISRIWILAERPFQSLYQFDVIYGQGNETIQYLAQEDLKRYLTGLVEHRDHLCSDPSYLTAFQGEHLGKLTDEKRKDVDYKHRVICFLLSHANTFPSDFGKVALLRSIATVPDKAKTRILLPSIKTLVENAASMPAADVFLSTSEELTMRLLASYDVEAAGTLNNDAESWEVFLKVVRTFQRPGTLLAVQKAVVHTVTGGLFVMLNQRRQLALCSLLLEVGSSDPSTQSLARGSLSDVLNDVSLIVELLDRFAPSVQENSPRAAKRPKTSETPEDLLPRLALLTEVLGTKSLPGSLELTTHLLETLNKVVQSLPAAQADVIYVQQLLMSAIESTSSKIREVPNISPNVIRIDVLVEVIRTSRNPQTFHQALLLVANLARLAPDSVLFNVMPVFTFMGSNVFHRDDSYSFKVVQETVNGIIPVMVSSLRESHSQPLDLYLAAKELLQVFTDAAAHIPRHRRNSFFSHLVDVFGRRDFLPPVSMLLLEKSANRVVRQAPDELQNTLALPITLFQQSGYDVQIHTATELLNEAQRLIFHINDPNSTQPTFMETMPDGEHTASPSTVLKRRAQALIIFVGLAMKPNKPGEGQSPISPLVAQLVALTTADTNSSAKLDDIFEAARSSLNRLLKTMSVINFMESVQSILLSGDVRIQAGAFDVLAKRLPEVSARMRPDLKDNIEQILQSTKNFLHINTNGDAPTFAFQALKAIADTLCVGEEGSLADVVPYVLSSMNEKDLAFSSLAALPSISVKLGPRIIPFFRQVISQCVSILRGHDSALFGDALSTLQGLLKTIPAFWGRGELSQVVFLYMDQRSSASNSNVSGISTLIKSLARKIPAKVLIPTLVEMWDPLQGSKNISRISAFFDTFGRALQHADRPTVLDYIRDIFKIFLEALDIVKVHDEAESRVIHAFREMVVKLTESAFKPLFRRLHDWAFVGAIDPERQTTFCHLYIHLLDFFKGLMVPYVSFLLQPLVNTLDSFKSNDHDIALWSSVINVLTRTFSHDENGFWRDEKLRQLLTGLTNQIEIGSKLDSVEKTQLQDCFVAFLDIITDDTLVKAVNLNILMHTRSESLQTRIFALSCSEVIWLSHRGKLLGFVAETATFIAECGEDENDLVIIAASKLKDAVEAVAGKIDGL